MSGAKQRWLAAGGLVLFYAGSAVLAGFTLLGWGADGRLVALPGSYSAPPPERPGRAFERGAASDRPAGDSDDVAEAARTTRDDDSRASRRAAARKRNDSARRMAQKPAATQPRQQVDPAVPASGSDGAPEGDGALPGDARDESLFGFARWPFAGSAEPDGRTGWLSAIGDRSETDGR